MAKQIKIGTLNLCLGLENKKELVFELLNENSVYICGLQETEIPPNFPEHILNSGGFTLELENNSDKKRAGFYIKNEISYIRRYDLERENTHLLIVMLNYYSMYTREGSAFPPALRTK